MQTEKPKKKLNRRENRFIDEMANPKTKSVRQAGIKAGYAAATASTIIYKKLEDTRISDAIQKRINRALSHTSVTAEEVLGSAAFNMRTSFDDLIDDDGYADLAKARETGAIDLIKEMEIVETIDLKTMHKTIRHKIKIESPASARKEVAEYLEKAAKLPIQTFTDEEIAKELFGRMIEKYGWNKTKALKGIKERFPAVDLKLLTENDNA
jgi:hypothetical protein